MRTALSTLLAVTFLSVGAFAFETPEETWGEYIHAVGSRSDMNMLACYATSLRNQLDDDNRAAGRARLDMHMADMFKLLFKDYDYEITNKEETSGDAILTVAFKHRRKKDVQFERTVEFIYEDGRWLIIKPPEPEAAMAMGKGSVKMLLGVAAAGIIIVIIMKKALG